MAAIPGRDLSRDRGLSASKGAFSAEEHATRVARVRDSMAADHHDLDALLVTSPENIYYLIGLTHQGYFAFTMLVLPREGSPSLLTRRMEAYTISQQAPDIHHIGYGDDDGAGAAAVEALRGLGTVSGRVGVDRSSMFLPAGVWEDMEQGRQLHGSGHPSRREGADRLRHDLPRALLDHRRPGPRLLRLGHCDRGRREDRGGHDDTTPARDLLTRSL